MIDIDVAGKRDMNTLESLPGAAAGDSLEFAYDFLGKFKGNKLNIKSIGGESFQLDMHYDKKNKFVMKNASGTKLFKRHGIRAFAQVFERYFNNLSVEAIKKLDVDKDNPIVMTIKLPKGVYKSTNKRLHESTRLTRELNQIIF